MQRLLPIYCLLAGGCDTLTGLLLVASPSTTLAILGVGQPTPDDPATFFLRWIGVFVAAVGMAYLYPLLLPPSARRRRLRPVLELTTLVRLGVALFLAARLVGGDADPAWVTVMLTDLGLALFQLEILRRRLVP